MTNTRSNVLTRAFRNSLAFAQENIGTTLHTLGDFCEILVFTVVTVYLIPTVIQTLSLFSQCCLQCGTPRVLGLCSVYCNRLDFKDIHS